MGELFQYYGSVIKFLFSNKKKPCTNVYRFNERRFFSGKIGSRILVLLAFRKEEKKGELFG
jgi:hypothetical protein